MAIMPYQDNHTLVQPWEYLPVTASEVYTIGGALKVASGAVTKQSGANKPKYISMAQEVNANKLLPVIHINADMIYEAPLSAAAATLAVGSTVNLDATGTMFTAADNATVAEVVSFTGKAAGDPIRVRFL